MPNPAKQIVLGAALLVGNHGCKRRPAATHRRQIGNLGCRCAERRGRVFKLDDIVEAHRCMEENKAGGKIVVLT